VETVNRTNLFCALAGPRGSGKSTAIESSHKVLGLAKPTLIAEKFGSVEGLAKTIGNVGNDRRLWYPNELSHPLKKANIEGATFDRVLNDAYYNTEQNLTIAHQKRVEFSCQLSLIGGLLEDEFAEMFGPIGGGGFYDRFILGQCPTGFLLEWHPFEGSSEECQPVDVRIDPEVWTAKNQWTKDKGINPRVAEHAIRVATICAGFDGRDVLSANDLGAALAFAQYQERTRIVLRPNEGETHEGKLALAFIAYLDRAELQEQAKSNQGWWSVRKMYQGTRAYEKGPGIADKALRGLAAAGEVELTRIGKLEVVRRCK
jgi:hypothetical protein